jgi:O-antigen/teichoic acid export membrane protein
MTTLSRIDRLRQVFFSKTAGQTYTLFGSSIANGVLLFASTAVIARLLGPDDWGVYSFYLRITAFIVLFFGFGLSYAVAVLLAQQTGEFNERRLIGAGLVVGMGIGVIYGLFTLSFSFFVDDLFDTTVGASLRSISPLLIAFPLQTFVRQIGRGSTRTSSIAILNVMPNMLLLLSVLVSAYADVISLDLIIKLHATSIGITIVFIFISYRPVYDDHVWQDIRSIWHKTKQYGIHMYVGQIADMGSSALDSIFIPILVNTTELGFYTLARGLTMPVVAMSEALAMVQFKRLANFRKIPRRTILVNYLWLLASCTGLLIFGRWIVSIVFGSEYSPVASFLLPLVAAAFFSGAQQLYGSFLVGHAKRLIGYFSFATLPVNLLGYTLLISRYRACGAALTLLVRGFLWFIMYYVYYLVVVKKDQHMEEVI